MNMYLLKNLTIKIAKIVSCITLCIFFTVIFYSYNATDTSWFYQGTQLDTTQNYLGTFGAYSAALLLYVFGSTILLGFIFLVWLTYLFATDQSLRSQNDRLLGIALFIPVCCAIARHYSCEIFSENTPGGFIGVQTYSLINRVIFNLYSGAFLYVATCGLLVMIFRFTFVRRLYPIYVYIMQLSITEHISQRYISVKNRYISARAHMLAYFTTQPGTRVEDAIYEIYQDPIWQTLGIPAVVEDIAEQHEIPEIMITPVIEKNKKKQVHTSPELVDEDAIHKSYMVPNKHMLKVPSDALVDQEQQKESVLNAQILQEKLERFGIQGKVTAIINGPVVTLFEYQPTIDTKVSTILARENDLALALQAISLRIIAPIPGKSVVGFEVAHNKRKTVYFSSLLMSKQWTASKSVLPLIIGQDTLGENIIIDLAKMPHLLVAGSTGSGKSAGLNSMLMSLLYSKTPHQLRLVLIDPKRLEFASYADIAHLLFPIITEPTKAVFALKWLVRTMEERYETMAKLSVRNIEDYYKMYGHASEHHMPYIVVVMDELADLMMTASKDAEQLIARLAQMARAAGIHLIIATQRPSVDVITGLIKVNFPSRIAFKVTSKVDSRTIIDGAGAEKLLGRGDMLFMDSSGSLNRVHGAYVSDEEIHKVVSYVKAQQEVEYELLQVPQTVQESQEGDDELLDDVISFLEKREDISISLVQRAFRIGYNRSARIVEQLEMQGHILPADGSKMRKVAKNK